MMTVLVLDPLGAQSRSHHGQARSAGLEDLQPGAGAGADRGHHHPMLMVGGPQIGNFTEDGDSVGTVEPQHPIRGIGPDHRQARTRTTQPDQGPDIGDEVLQGIHVRQVLEIAHVENVESGRAVCRGSVEVGVDAVGQDPETGRSVRHETSEEARVVGGHGVDLVGLLVPPQLVSLEATGVGPARAEGRAFGESVMESQPAPPVEGAESDVVLGEDDRDPPRNSAHILAEFGVLQLHHIDLETDHDIDDLGSRLGGFEEQSAWRFEAESVSRDRRNPVMKVHPRTVRLQGGSLFGILAIPAEDQQIELALIRQLFHQVVEPNRTAVVWRVDGVRHDDQYSWFAERVVPRGWSRGLYGDRLPVSASVETRRHRGRRQEGASGEAQRHPSGRADQLESFAYGPDHDLPDEDPCQPNGPRRRPFDLGKAVFRVLPLAVVAVALELQTRDPLEELLPGGLDMPGCRPRNDGWGCALIGHSNNDPPGKGGGRWFI